MQHGPIEVLASPADEEALWRPRHTLLSRYLMEIGSYSANKEIRYAGLGTRTFETVMNKPELLDSE